MTETKTARSFANPVLQKLQNVIRQEASSTTATYSGIAAKTAFFLVMAVIGAALFICLHPIWIASGNTLDVSVEGVMVQIAVAELIIAGVSLLILFISPFIALFNHRLLAVVGTLYCLCEGYLISWTSVFLTPDMQWVPWCALALTILDRSCYAALIYDRCCPRRTSFSLFPHGCDSDLYFRQSHGLCWNLDSRRTRYTAAYRARSSCRIHYVHCFRDHRIAVSSFRLQHGTDYRRRRAS